MDPEFLDLEDVLEAHRAGLERWGGAAGVRDPGGLEAAIAQPRATFDGAFLYADIYAMAAAYAFHIAQAQAFVDGNKRAGLLAALVFLDVNGIRVPEPGDALYLAMLAIAERTMTKDDLGDLLRGLPKAR